jgi:hypothetical protein
VRALRHLAAAVAVVAAAAAVAAVASCARTIASRPLSDALPSGLPSKVARADWERIDGDYDTPTEHVRYALFVDPELPLLFRITQYRVTLRKGTSGPARDDDGMETVIWNATPRQRGPLRCFTADPVPRSRPSAATWRDVDPSSQEFRAHMNRAIEIYGRVRREGRAGPPVK